MKSQIEPLQIGVVSDNEFIEDNKLTTWPTWSLQLSVINNIMYAVKTLYTV